ncbi:hypothetical protein [Sphingobacterium lumbrici]|uniref:hypothetical protein n=1 Tax=Sphingobacterium lumbrici TaxID=2559600 RepID=UPI00112D60A7|nr:hypothetical protein [Sphingobacterium lumbrici]
MKNRWVYKESQNFLTWWLVLVFVLVIGLGLYTGWNANGNTGWRDFSTGFWIGSGIALLFLFMRLRTQIDERGIHIRFIPFIWKEKTWKWEDIGKVHVKKYSPWEYGGWGWRFGGPGVAYTTKGFYGIWIVLKNGKAILVGTQHPENVQELLDHYKPNKDEA